MNEQKTTRLQANSDSKLSYVDLAVVGKGTVATGMLDLRSGIVTWARPINGATRGEVQQATELRQQSSGTVAAIKYCDLAFSLANPEDLARFDGYEEDSRVEGQGPEQRQAEPEMLTPSQVTVLKGFYDGDFAHLADGPAGKDFRAAVANSGNGLLRYLMADLSTGEDCRSHAEALKRLDGAIGHLIAARHAVAAEPYWDLDEAEQPSSASAMPGA